jgi:hypothetical protein
VPTTGCKPETVGLGSWGVWSPQSVFPESSRSNSHLPPLSHTPPTSICVPSRFIKCVLLYFPADEVGNERGYLVEMAQDTLDEPYKMSPGQKVRLVSNYDARTDHYGTALSCAVTGAPDVHWPSTRKHWEFCVSLREASLLCCCGDCRMAL